MVNEYLRGCLIHVRRLCSLASLPRQQEPDCAIELLRLDSTVTMTLTEFVSLQRSQCKVAEEKLRRLRKAVVDTVLETCVVSWAGVLIKILVGDGWMYVCLGACAHNICIYLCSTFRVAVKGTCDGFLVARMTMWQSLSVKREHQLTPFDCSLHVIL